MCRAVIKYKYSLNCISVTSVQFRMLCVIFHESDLQYGVTHRHHLTTNGVGHACEHD